MHTLELPTPPTFLSLDEERNHRKIRLAAAFRVFSRFGLDDGVTGHITARDPEYLDHLWVNPWGVSFSQIRASDLCLIDAAGNLVEGVGPVNPAAITIHASVHDARPDVVAVAHSHSLHGKTWSAFGRKLDPITQDACAFYERHSVFDQYNGVVLDDIEGRSLAESLGGNRAAILKNHGILTVGATVDEAAWWFISLERSCQAQLLALAAGEPDSIPAETAREVAALYDQRAGWFNFQPIFARIMREQPDLAE
ncbi:class II aldolase/adducin family protein [Rhodococcus sp. NPDC003348]